MNPYRGLPTLNEEIRGWREGYRHVAGIDEAGRGPMAGPVVAAAVILDPQFAAPWWSELRDSKLLPAKRREELAQRLRETAACAAGSASHEEIDELGLLVATRQTCCSSTRCGYRRTGRGGSSGRSSTETRWRRLSQRHRCWRRWNGTG
jgi:hypothetical protein